MRFRPDYALQHSEITTLAPFGRSLRHLIAGKTSLAEIDMITATNLVTLDCSYCSKIRSVAFCLNTLQELKAEGCGVYGCEFVKATT